jgi:NADP-dependent 3-hydroxy acid dehydrogenase YdfG
MMTTSWTTPLTGTVALITGASSGIGEATARRLAEHGAVVALVARRRDRLEALARDILEAGGAALVIDADITDPAQAETAVRQTVEHFGRLDTLVHNAGLMLLGPVVDADRDDWNDHHLERREGHGVHIWGRQASRSVGSPWAP